MTSEAVNQSRNIDMLRGEHQEMLLAFDRLHEHVLVVLQEETVNEIKKWGPDFDRVLLVGTKDGDYSVDDLADHRISRIVTADICIEQRTTLGFVRVGGIYLKQHTESFRQIRRICQTSRIDNAS